MLDLLTDCLAAYRLTRLVTADTITEAPRRAVVELAYDLAQLDPPGPRDSEPISDWVADQRARGLEVPKLADLVTCRWCTGMWVAGGVGIARLVAPRAWSWWSRMLAVASGAALIAGMEQD
ncbi:MAG: hypothetical protein SHS37scaffold145_81 [Phage 71_18]|nr:MAG: hypothetical protein SHS37scaffold145_81 [Phage 71_18]